MTVLRFDVRELFDGANTAHVATLMRDGSPRSVPMWIGVEGNRLASSARRTGSGPTGWCSSSDGERAWAQAFG